MMNNKLLYFDSADAKSLGLTVSNDYAFNFIANIPWDEGFDSRQGGGGLQEDELLKMIRQSESVGLFITDILFYRFLLSITSSFSISKQSDLLGLLVSSSERVFDSLDRTDVWRLMNHPDVAAVESVFKEIIDSAQAENEMTAIPLISKWRTIHTFLYSGEADIILSNFTKNSRMVDTFPLRTNQKKLEEVIRGNSEIVIANDNSPILQVVPGIAAIRGGEEVFNPLFRFCDSICTVFSAIFVQGEESEELDDAYRRIWTFLLRSKSSCFVPKSVINKAKEVLL